MSLSSSSSGIKSLTLQINQLNSMFNNNQTRCKILEDSLNMINSSKSNSDAVIAELNAKISDLTNRLSIIES